MSQSLYTPASEPGPEGYSVDISPQSAGWRYSSMRVVHVAPHATATFDTDDSEWIVLPLSGSCRVTCGESTFELEGRTSVFERVTDFAYVPRDATVTLLSAPGGRFALLGAVCDNVLSARYGRAQDVPVELRGAGSASRQANNFAAP